MTRPLGGPGDDARLDQCLEVVLALARLEFGLRAEVTGDGGRLDALSAGLNMLGEELAASTVTVAELERHVAARTAELEERARLLQTLFKELHHRVKNNLQIVTSLLRFYSEDCADPVVREAFRQTAHRVRAMSLVHELLYRTDDLRAVDLRTYLRELAAELQRSYRDVGAVTVELDVAALAVPQELAVPVGLIATELLSNAWKHAFPAGRAGRIRLELRAPADGAADRTAALVVADDGIGAGGEAAPPAGPTPRMGVELVRSLARQLHGAVVVDRAAGTTVTVTMDLERRGA